MLSSPPAELGRRQSDFLDDLLGLRTRSANERAMELVKPPVGGVEDRWAIYASGFLARLVEALENDYPAVARRRCAPGDPSPRGVVRESSHPNTQVSQEEHTCLRSRDVC